MRVRSCNGPYHLACKGNERAYELTDCPALENSNGGGGNGGFNRRGSNGGGGGGFSRTRVDIDDELDGARTRGALDGDDGVRSSRAEAFEPEEDDDDFQ